MERLVDFPRDQSRQLLERCRPPRAIGQTGQNLPGVVLFAEIAPVDGEQQRPPYQRQTDHQPQRHQPDLGRCLGEDVDQRLLTVTIQVGGQQDDRHAHQREHRVARERVLNGLADDETGLEDPVDDHRVRRDHGHEQNGEGYHERGGPGPTRRREVLAVRRHESTQQDVDEEGDHAEHQAGNEERDAAPLLGQRGANLGDEQREGRKLKGNNDRPRDVARARREPVRSKRGDQHRDEECQSDTEQRGFDTTGRPCRQERRLTPREVPGKAPEVEWNHGHGRHRQEAVADPVEPGTVIGDTCQQRVGEEAAEKTERQPQPARRQLPTAARDQRQADADEHGEQQRMDRGRKRSGQVLAAGQDREPRDATRDGLGGRDGKPDHRGTGVSGGFRSP